MANKIKPKRSYTANAVPTTSDLDANELAINWVDGKAYTKNAAGNIVSVTLGGSGGGSGSIVTAASVSAFPASGSASNLYITTEDQRIWRWDATASIYVESGPIGGGFAFASVPSSPTATGSTGQVATDGAWWYYCSAPNTWVRTALSTWSNFTPASVTGLQLWLDASDASSLYDATSGGSLVAADGAVARWQDKSGNARHATQATSGSRPLCRTAVKNGMAALEFNGTSNYLDISSTLSFSEYTVFVVAKRSTVSGSAGILSSDNGAGTRSSQCCRVSGANIESISFSSTTGGTVVTATSSATVSANEWFTAAVTQSSTTLSIYKNGTSVASVSATHHSTAVSPTVGRLLKNLSDSFMWDGNIAEIIFYSNALSDTSRAAVSSYLIQKWGIT